MSKISIIIPAYNSTNTISRCINSIQSQTFSDFELIIIDDCSLDDTLSKIENYADKDKRIKVFKNQTNMGAGYSRNKGLSIATGDYISFIDSDDFIDTNTYQSICNKIKEFNYPDIIRYKQCYRLYMGTIPVSLNFFTNNIYNNATGMLVPIDNPEYVALESPGVCNKIFKRELIDDTKFPLTKWEDYPFCTLLLGKAKNIVFDKNAKYYYCHPITFSNTTLNYIKNPSQSLLSIYDCCDMVENNYKKAGLFDVYEKAIRSNQKIHSLQRIRDIMFSTHYTNEEKKIIINYLIRLTTMKYGEVFSDEYYQTLKANKLFYKTRMDYVEKFYYNSTNNTCDSEEKIKSEIKRLVRS